MAETIVQEKPAPKAKARFSNLDLLKIIAFMMVVFLHFMNEGMGGGLRYAEGTTRYIYVAIEALCAIAVPLFVLITGYFSVNSKSFSLKKVVGLYILQFSYRLICYLLEVIIFKVDFSAGSFFACFIPNNYFINFYVVLLIFIPFFNKLFKLDRKTVNTFMIIFGLLFVLFPTVVNAIYALAGKDIPSGLSFITMVPGDYGINIVSFIFFYFAGAYIRFYNVRFKKIYTILAYLASSAIIFALYDKNLGFVHYHSLFLAISGISFFMLFESIKMKEIKVISFISKCSLGVFVLHTTSLFLIQYNGLFEIQANIEAGPGQAVLVFLGVTMSTIAICMAADILLRLAVTPVRNWLYKTKLLNYKIIDLEESK